MYTLSDKSHFQAHAVMHGKHKLPVDHQEIMDWISEQFGVRALDFYCETRESSKGQQQLVNVILEKPEDVKAMQANRDASALVTERFRKHLASSPEIVVTWRPLKVLKEQVRQEMLNDEQRALLKSYESVWTLSMAVVFYYTDAQIKENLANGTSQRINDELNQVIRKYGFDTSSDYRFDSKESFDRDYSGDWHQYWQ